MILPWVVAAAALAVALLAWVRTRRLAQRLDQLLQMYWELKYQHGELRRELQQVTGQPHQSAPDVSGIERSEPQRPTPPTDAFVPLASLKR
jgi:hypothetical protein